MLGAASQFDSAYAPLRMTRRGVNIFGRGELRSPAGAPRRSPTGENVDFKKYQISLFFSDSRGRLSLQVCAYVTIASLSREVALRSNDGRSL